MSEALLSVRMRSAGSAEPEDLDMVLEGGHLDILHEGWFWGPLLQLRRRGLNLDFFLSSGLLVLFVALVTSPVLLAVLLALASIRPLHGKAAAGGLLRLPLPVLLQCATELLPHLLGRRGILQELTVLCDGWHRGLSQNLPGARLEHGVATAAACLEAFWQCHRANRRHHGSVWIARLENSVACTIAHVWALLHDGRRIFSCLAQESLCL
mmetsp:Transcript_101281/g.255067  ORF Transcript_101281/g.255067 Transcript_101281/m.255067 type:complete len:210 (-) Transcript_101281:874-1503(-)